MDRHLNNDSGTGENNAIAISYSSYISKRLPFLFRTICLNYSKIGFTSQKDCHNNCLINRTLSELNLVPHFAMVDVPHDKVGTQRGIETTKNRKRFVNEALRIKTECKKKCSSPDCLEVVHSPRIAALGRADDLRIVLLVADSPDIVSVHSTTRTN